MRTAGRLVTLFILLLSISNGLFAKIYSWTDESGTAHYSQFPPMDISYNEVDIQLSPTFNTPQSTLSSDNTDYDTPSQINCLVAVNRGEAQVKKLLKKYPGNINLKGALNQMSLSECKSSDGKVHNYYKYLTKSNADVVDCGKRYDY